jgi:hypothetical protein
MGPALRRAAAATGLHFRTVHRECVLTEEQRRGMRLGSTRIAAVAPCARALRRLTDELGLAEGGASDDEDRLNEVETAQDFLSAFSVLGPDDDDA